MATTSKYFVLPSVGSNFLDFELSYGALSLHDQEIVFVGSTTVDAIFVRPGVIVDFTASGASADKIYLAGNQADYAASLVGTTMTLTRGSGSTLETVRFVKSTTTGNSDQLVFADGTLSSLALYNNLNPQTHTALPALGGESSGGAISNNASLNASIKAFALDAAGETFAMARNGISLTVVGSTGVDTVYVPNGGNVDASALGASTDLIYFRGNWNDYTKTVAGTAITFTRSVEGMTESVKVIAANNVAQNDRLVFADGSVLSYNARTAVNSNASVAISGVSGYDASTVTPGLAPTVAITSNATAVMAGETATIIFTFSEAPNGFTLGDVHATNGTVSGLVQTIDPKVYVATFTPTASLASGSAVVSVDAASYSGVQGAGGAGVSPSIAIDTLPPTATIVVADNALKIGETSLVTITFSEAVNGFTNADLTVANGTLSNVVSSDGGRTWTATLTPTADMTDTSNVISLDNTGVTDLAGNAGAGRSDSNNYAIDTLAATTTSTALAVGNYGAGDYLTFNVQFSEAVSISGGNPTLSLTIGANGRTAIYDGTTSSATNLMFKYLVTNTDLSTVNGSNILTVNSFNGSIQDLAGNTVATPTLNNIGSTVAVVVDGATQGSGMDGYLSGVTIFADNDNSGSLTASDSVAITNATGGFKLYGATGPLVMYGGTDISTGLDFSVQYEAPTGYNVINPVSTLIRAVQQSGSLSNDAAYEVVRTAIYGAAGGPDASEIGSYDPFQVATDATSTSQQIADAVAYQRVAAAIATLVDIASEAMVALAVSGGTPVHALDQREASVLVFDALAVSNIPSGGLWNALQDGAASGFVADLISGLAPEGAEIANVVALVDAAMTAIAAAGTGVGLSAIEQLTEITKVQVVAQDYLNGDLSQTFNGTNFTNDVINADVGVIVPVQFDIVADAGNASVLEGQSGETPMLSFAVTRSGNTTVAATINYQVVGGSDLTSADFAEGVIPSGELAFAVGETSKSINISLAGNNLRQGSRPFVVSLVDNSGGAQLATPNAFATIVDDDPFTPVVYLNGTADVAAGSPTSVVAVVDYYDPSATLAVTVAASNANASALTIEGNLASVNVALAALTLNGTAGQTQGTLDISVSVAGRTGSASSVLTVHNAPTEDLPGSLAVTAGQASAVTGLAVHDVDGSNLTVDLTATHGALALGDSSNVAVIAITGGLQLTGAVADLNATLQTVSYTGASGQSSGVISMVTSDNDGLTGDASGTVNVTIAAAAPTLTLPGGAAAVTVGVASSVTGLSVADSDSAILTVTLNAGDGTLQATASGAAVLTGNNGSALTITGASADVNATLAGLRFTATGATPTLTASVSDGDSTTTDPTNVSVNLAVVSNTAPSAGGNLTITSVTEDTQATLSIQPTTLSDVDGTAPSAIRILSVTGGSLVDSSDTAIVLGTAGSVLNLSNGSVGVKFTPDSNRNTTASISYVVVDPLVNTLNSAPSTITVPITAVNDAPVVSPATGSITYAENGTGMKVAATATIADVDSSQMSGATITITNHRAGDLLAASGLPAGITASAYNADTGVITLSGTASRAEYETALRLVKFSNSSDNPDTTARAINIVVNDVAVSGSQASSAAATRTVNVIAVNDAPIVSGMPGTALAYTENAGAQAIGGGLTLTDADSDYISSAVVAITSGYRVGEDMLAAGTLTGGISASFNASNGRLTLSGTASVADYQTALQSVTYTNASDNPSTNARIVSLIVADSPNLLPSTQASRSITITPTADAPVVDLNGLIATGSNNSVMFVKALYPNGIAVAPNASISDIDSTQLSKLTVTLTSAQSGDALSLSASAQAVVISSGITTAITANQITFTGNVGLSTYSNLLKGVLFSSSTDTVEAARDISVVATDITGALLVSTNTQITVYEAASAFATVAQGSGTLTLTGNPGSDSVTVNLPGMTVSTPAGNLAIDGDPIFTAQNVNASGATGVGVTIIGNSGVNTLTGSAGNDILIGGGGADIISGGAGDDRITYQAGSTLAGGDGTDILVVKGNFDLANPGAALSGFEIITAAGASAGVSLTGGNGAQTLMGGAFNDTLKGGGGSDTLIGGLGKDTFDVSDTGNTTGSAVTIADLALGDSIKGVTANWVVQQTSGINYLVFDGKYVNLGTTLPSPASSWTLSGDTLSVIKVPTQTVAITAMTRDSGASSSDFLTKDGAARIVSGTISAELGANEVVKVSFDGGASWTTTATTNGTNWSANDSGTHNANWTIQARVVNTDANANGALATRVVTFDNQVATLALSLSNDTGINSDSITSNAAITVTGQEAGATVQYSGNGTVWGSSIPAPAQGSNTVYVRQIDVAGNTSTTANLNFTYDIVAPTAPTGMALASGSDSGVLGDRLTNITTPTVTGTAEAGSTVTVKDGSVILGTAVAASNGNWSLDVATPLGAHGHAILATARDVAGNVSGTASMLLNIDTAAPGITIASDKTALKIGETATLTFTLSEATADFVVGDVTVAGGTLSNFSGSGLGYTATFTPTAGSTANGTANVAVTKFTDAAGNANTASNTVTVAIDTAAPAAPIVTPADSTPVTANNTIYLNSGQFNVSGLEANATWQYTLNGGTAWINGSGSSFTLVNGSYGSNVQVRQIDQAGNAGTPDVNDGDPVIVDTVAPSITSNSGGASASVNVAENTTAVTTVTATDANGALTYSIIGGADAAKFAINSGSGALTFISAPDFENKLDIGADNVYDVTVQASDIAGNTDTQAIAVTVTDVVESDVTLPVLQSAAIVGNTLTLTYSETLDIAHQPNLASFNVAVNGLGRSAIGLQVSGSQVVLTLGTAVSVGDAVIVSYSDPSGDNAYATQDAAGNDAASLAAVTVTNSTTNPGSDTTQPSMVGATFTAGTNSISLIYNEGVQLNNSGQPPTLLKNGTDVIAITNATVSGGTITLTTDTTLLATDHVVVNYQSSGLIRDIAGNWANQGTVVIGGSGDNSVNLDDSNNLAYPVALRGNDGDDTLTGTGSGDMLAGGSGADVINGGWGDDRIYLSDGATRATDTVVVGIDGESNPNWVDRVYGFDTTGTTTNDKLNLPSNTIAANASNVNGGDVGALKSHSIAGGIVTFGSTDAGGTSVAINAANVKDAVAYLDANITAGGSAVGFAVDTDGNGYADSLFVFEQTGAIDEDDTLVALHGVVGATLGTVQAQNVVQIVDTTGPTINGATLTTSGLILTVNEVVQSVDFAGLTLLKNGTGANIASGTTVSGSTVTVNTSTLAAADFVLLRVYDINHQSATDTHGNTANQFAQGDVGFAIGGASNTAIDLSGIVGDFDIHAGNDLNNTLTGSGGNNSIRGAGGNDTINAGAGDDELRSDAGNDALNGGLGNDQMEGGTGADALDGGAGADQFVFRQGDSTPVSYSAGNGTYTFTGGADVIAGSGFTVTGQNGDRIEFRTNASGIQSPQAMGSWNQNTFVPSVPADGLATDQHYFLQRGNFSGGVFTVNASGADTIVVYDGDPTAGVSQTAFVIAGVQPGQLTNYQWGQIFLTDVANQSPTLTIASSVRTVDEDSNNTGRPIGYNGAEGSLNVAVGTGGAFANQLTLTDVDSANFNGGTLKVSITSGGNSAQLRLGIAGSPGLFSVNQTSGDVTYYRDATINGTTGANASAHVPENVSDAIIIGQVDATHRGQHGDQLWINLNANATPAITQLLASQVYLGVTNISDLNLTQDWAAVAGNKTVQFAITDSASGTPVTASRVMNVVSHPDGLSRSVADGAYHVGDTLTVTATFDEAVVVSGGTPSYALDIGGVTKQATYVSGSGTTQLVFSYVVESGLSDADGIDIPQLSLNGATIAGLTGAASASSVGVLHYANVTVGASVGPDTVSPTLQTATINGDTITLTYNEALDPAHQPSASYFQVMVNNTALGTSSFRIANEAISGNTVVLTLGVQIASTDVVTVSYTDPSGSNDVYAVQDSAGNDAAMLSNQAVTNNSPTTNSTPPSLLTASFSETANATVTLVFNETMQASNPGNLVLLKNGTGSNILTGVSGIAAGAVTFTTSATLSATDHVVVTYRGNGDLRDLSNNYVNYNTVVIGGSGVSNLDLDNIDWSNYTTPITIRGNSGDDVLTGSGSNDQLYGGNGADILNGGWGADRIVLGENTRASDTVVVDTDGSSSSQPYFYDEVFGFDVTSAATNDKLNLPSKDIAANATHVDGADSGTLAKHSVTSGIVTFEDASGNAILINNNNLNTATDYLEKNFTAPGKAVAFQVDTDNNGSVDSLFVFQDQGGPDLDNDILIKLAGVTGVTLGITAGQNVVQLLDTTAPNVTGGSLTATGLVLHYSETVASVDFANIVLQQGNGATLSAMTPNGSPAVSGNTVTIATGTNLGANDYVLISSSDIQHQSATDSFGNTSNLFDSANVGHAIGGAGNTVIDLSALSGDFGLEGGAGDDTLTGNAGDNEMDGGTGNDVFIAGAGDDYLSGDAGADSLNGGAGADEYSFTQGDSTPVSLSNGVYTFTGGADVISGGFTVAAVNNNSSSGDRIHFRSDMPGNGMAAMGSWNNNVFTQNTPANGLATDQGYFLQRGSYNGTSFTLSAGGTDTLVVYDGNSATGAVSQTALVIKDVNPTQLAMTYGGGVYLNVAGTAEILTAGHDTYSLPAAPLTSKVVNGSSGTDTINVHVYPTDIIPQGFGLHFGDVLDPSSYGSSSIIFDLEKLNDGSYNLSGYHNAFQQPVTDYGINLQNFESVTFDDGTYSDTVNFANDIGMVNAAQAVGGVLHGETLATGFKFATFEVASGVSQVIGGATIADSAVLTVGVAAVSMIEDSSGSEPVWRVFDGANAEVFNIKDATPALNNDSSWIIDYASTGVGADLTLNNIEYALIVNNADDSVLRLSLLPQPTTIL